MNIYIIYTSNQVVVSGCKPSLKYLGSVIVYILIVSLPSIRYYLIETM